MALNRLLPAQSTSEFSMAGRQGFYATSWLLVHYLQFSPAAREQKLTEKMRELLKRHNNGRSSADEFEDVFSTSLDDFDKALKAYSESKLSRFGIPMDRVTFDGTYKKEALTKGQIAYEIGSQIVVRNPGYARKLFQRVLKKSALDARALAGVGVSWQMEEDYPKAREWVQRALDAAPNDYLIHIEMADLIAQACLRKNVPDCGWNDARQASFTHRKAAYELNPDLLETKVRYSQALRAQGRDNEAVPVLEAAQRLAPWNLQVVTALGLAHLATGNLDLAETYLERALGWSGKQPGVQNQVQAALTQVQLLRSKSGEEAANSES